MNSSIFRKLTPRHVPQKRRVTFEGLHSVTPQKMELFLLYAVYTSGNVKVKLSLCLTKHYAKKAYGGVDVLTSALAGGEWSASCPGHFSPGERAPGTHWIGGWVDDLEKILDPTGTRTPTTPGAPARSQSLHRLRYPGSFTLVVPKHFRAFAPVVP
jgi:hypothetical protein